MKIFRLITVLSIVLGIMSCATMSQAPSQGQQTMTSSNNSAAYTAGTACGSALVALYNQYKAAGKIDLSNPTNLIHLATLASSSANLKENLKNTTYFQGFANGTIFGSKNTITTSSATNILNSLAGFDLSSLTKKNTATTTQTTNAVSSVVNLLQLLK